VVAETDFSQAMLSEEARFVDITVDTHNTAFSSILPHGDITLIG
jgi:hypothetical protein